MKRKAILIGLIMAMLLMVSCGKPKLETIGNDRFGYVQVVEGWQENTSEQEGAEIRNQYVHAQKQAVLFLGLFEESNYTPLQESADVLMEAYKSEGMTDMELVKDSKIGEKDAYQIKANLEKEGRQVQMSTWLFEEDGEKVHVISLVAEKENFEELEQQVQSSFTFTMPQDK